MARDIKQLSLKQMKTLVLVIALAQIALFMGHPAISIRRRSVTFTTPTPIATTPCISTHRPAAICSNELQENAVQCLSQPKSRPKFSTSNNIQYSGADKP